jgi:hypothetical protein
VPVIVDWLTGEVRQALIFVAVIGASNDEKNHLGDGRGRRIRRTRPSTAIVLAVIAITASDELFAIPGHRDFRSEAELRQAASGPASTER